ncbi:MAG: DNA topoisomerase IB [Chloroflexi bacterium]|nr:DNA topoisomerase IB [Chloroflexota bacterium]
MTQTENGTIPIDPVETARLARLHYVSDDSPGYRRKRQGRGFTYLDASGERLSDPAERERIEKLVIPPAWTDIWICPDPNGHILATGRDSKGRKQYIYHPRWQELRNQTKFSRMVDFGEALPAIREQTDRDLRRQGLPREKVLATAVRLLETTLIRIGNDEYARSNQSFGLTTLRDRHVKISGSKVEFRFGGKSGKEHTIELHNRRLARIVKQCQEIPGHDLFQYIDDSGQRQSIGSGDVNDYLRAITGQDFTAKDFRTWGGTVRAVQVLLEIGPSETATALKRNVSAAVKCVAGELGNTVTVCRQYYIHPAVLECYETGALFDVIPAAIASAPPPDSPYALTPAEAAVIMFLRQCALNP